jgi:uncharacterized protein (TIGR01440 family)
MNIQQLTQDMTKILNEFLPRAQLRPGQILVVGCSTSEVSGHHIGKESSVDVARAIFPPLEQLAGKEGLFLAIQCCEHLNRALVMSRECLERYNLVEVSAVPQPTAGGSFAAIAYSSLPDPVLAESVQGHAAIDIGDTFVGMHMRPVAVPLRLNVSELGQAHLTAARTRPRLIGGERAVYKQTEGVLKTCL